MTGKKEFNKINGVNIEQILHSVITLAPTRHFLIDRTLDGSGVAIVTPFIS